MEKMDTEHADLKLELQELEQKSKELHTSMEFSCFLRAFCMTLNMFFGVLLRVEWAEVVTNRWGNEGEAQDPGCGGTEEGD